MSLIRTFNSKIITILELREKTKKLMIKRSIKTLKKENKYFQNKVRH